MGVLRPPRQVCSNENPFVLEKGGRWEHPEARVILEEDEGYGPVYQYLTCMVCAIHIFTETIRL
jgi:hypothetical protein